MIALNPMWMFQFRFVWFYFYFIFGGVVGLAFFVNEGLLVF